MIIRLLGILFSSVLSTYMSYAYLDMRIRFYTNNKMHDVHLLNFPIFEKHTSEVLFTSMSQVLEGMRRLEI